MCHRRARQRRVWHWRARCSGAARWLCGRSGSVAARQQCGVGGQVASAWQYQYGGGIAVARQPECDIISVQAAEAGPCGESGVAAAVWQQRQMAAAGRSRPGMVNQGVASAFARVRRPGVLTFAAVSEVGVSGRRVGGGHRLNSQWGAIIKLYAFRLDLLMAGRWRAFFEFTKTCCGRYSKSKLGTKSREINETLRLPIHGPIHSPLQPYVRRTLRLPILSAQPFAH